MDSFLLASPMLLGGSRAALQSLLEVVHFPLRVPHLFAKLQVECPKGVLLYGPPGVGKTMLVSAVASICRAKMVSFSFFSFFFFFSFLSFFSH